MFGVVSPGWATPRGPRYWERAGKESNVGEFVSIGAPLSQHEDVYKRQALASPRLANRKFSVAGARAALATFMVPRCRGQLGAR